VGRKKLLGGDMPVKWKKTKFRGVRFYEHPSRKNGVRPDRYFAIRFQMNGKRREEGLGWGTDGWTEQKAAIELAKLKEAARKGEGPISLAEKREEAEARRKAKEAERQKQEMQGLTFGDFWRDTYYPQAQRDKTVRTWKREQSFFKKWLSPALNEQPLSKISPIDLERIKTHMAKAGLAPRSIAYCLDVVRQVFNHAAALGLYESEPPTAKVKRPKADNRRLRFLTQAEASTLLEALSKVSTDLHSMALLSLQCGLRAGELFNLQWRDIDLTGGTLTLRDKKNKRTRPAYLTKPALKMLKDRATTKDHELVFPSRSGGRRQQISRVFGKTVDEQGLNDGVTDPRDKVVFHTLRHTFASWLVMEGTPLYTVGKLLGHSTSAMTERYSHLAPDHMQAAVQALERAMERGESESKDAEGASS
jgi:integrase